MEFSSRGMRPSERTSSGAAPAAAGASAAAKSPKAPLSGKFKNLSTNKSARILGYIFLILLTILAASAIVLLAVRSDEGRYVNKDGYQVVALADKQVYFGKVTSINDDYISITDVYYLNQSDSTDASNDVRLIKRGGEVHCPLDRMTISRAQVNFWENISGEGQIAKLIQEWKDKNPSGQVCGTGGSAQQNTETNTGTGTDTQTGTDQSTGDATADDSATTPQP